MCHVFHCFDVNLPVVQKVSGERYVDECGLDFCLALAHRPRSHFPLSRVPRGEATYWLFRHRDAGGRRPDARRRWSGGPSMASRSWHKGTHFVVPTSHIVFVFRFRLLFHIASLLRFSAFLFVSVWRPFGFVFALLPSDFILDTKNM